MSSTKRAFLKAGAIISIVLAGICILEGILLGTLSSMVTEKSIKEGYENDTTTFTLVTDKEDETLEPGDYYFTYTVNDKEIKITRGEIVAIANVAKTVLNVFAWITILLSVANIIVAVLVIKDAKRNSNRKASIITLLVLSVLSGNLLTMAFMIVGLCLKNKPENEIIIETTQQ